MPPLSVAPYPGLIVVAFETTFPAPLGMLGSVPALADSLRPGAPAPLVPSDDVRAAVRDLLRARGYKPTGRGKPASEYLLRAAAEGTLGPINAAVDACNVVSLHSGLPISVIDLGLANAPLRVAVAGPDERYVFNASGQEIRIGGLPCLYDADGACANAVRDSQRTKTHRGTTRTLSLVWTPEALAARAETAARWYRDLLEALGAATAPVAALPAAALPAQ
ncbi:MAG: phenylalanine--tRNA ligase beta subunit-related protein [Rubricoccaceae bacterium]